ncbi:DUF6509 family protein [Paenibacillus tarimensis]|uniref:DUF6509 family protein n=1 Tax=Paenibacillus tarimensis TaxID=416012 RepID=UPI001F1A853A|nr:DUF6509 family protein [Paenibacillus tarimensis]MCF2944608.1 DUF6509 family protein [Paenibacillus tarimensis]
MNDLDISEYSVEYVKDPFGIITGKRYEFILDLTIDEDDELYSPQGVYARVIFGVEEEGSRIVKYDLLERTTDRYLEFDLDDEELQELETFCRTHYTEAEA